MLDFYKWEKDLDLENKIWHVPLKEIWQYKIAFWGKLYSGCT